MSRAIHRILKRLKKRFSPKKVKGRLKRSLPSVPDIFGPPPLPSLDPNYFDDASAWKTYFEKNTIRSTMHYDDFDVAAELYVDDRGVVKMPISHGHSFRYVPIVRWYDPDCVPAIKSSIKLDREYCVSSRQGGSHHSFRTNSLNVLFGADQYILLFVDTGIPVPQELMSLVTEHFQARGLSKLIDGPTIGVDPAHGQSKSAFTYASIRPDGEPLITGHGCGKDSPFFAGWGGPDYNKNPESYSTGFRTSTPQDSWFFKGWEQLQKRPGQ